MGEVTIPANPLRVIALDGPVLDAAILLGITPIGATTGVANDPWPSYLGDATAGITNVGTIVEPDLELVASLNPDLIIGVKSRHEQIHSQLSGIAPTVFLEQHRTGWRDGFVLIADALNRNDQVADVVTGFDTRCADVAAGMGDALATTSVSVLRVYTDILYAYQGGSFIGSVLENVGILRPENQVDPESLAVELSPEQVIEADGDVIFLAIWGDEASTDVNTVVGNPLWASLNAVRNNRVYLVDDEYWMVAQGYIAANLILDDLTAYLVEGQEPPAIEGA